MTEPSKKNVMEYEKHYYAPEGIVPDTTSYEEDLLFYENEWEK